MSKKRKPKRIAKVGPLELWVRRRAEDDEWGRARRKLREALAGLREALLETAPGRGVVGLLDRLEALLSRWKRRPR